MSSPEVTLVDQAGASGVVAETFRQIIVNPRLRLALGQVAAARPEEAGKRLGDIDQYCPEQWADKPLVSLDDLTNNGENPVVFSSLRTEAAAEYEDQFAHDRLVVSNAPANRMRGDTALINPFINGDQLDELYGLNLPGSGRIVGVGNCAGVPISVALAPIVQAGIGIEELEIVTLQGVSGAGHREIPEGWPLEIIDMKQQPDEKIKIETEPERFLGRSLQELAKLNITATPNRAPWLDGHHALIRATFDTEVKPRDIKHLWRSFHAPAEVAAIRSELKGISEAFGETWPHGHGPIKPIKALDKNLVSYHTTPPRLTRYLHPMRVIAHAKHRPVEIDPRIVELEAVGHNRLLGAAGSGAFNIIYARAKGYL